MFTHPIADVIGIKTTDLTQVQSDALNLYDDFIAERQTEEIRFNRKFVSEKYNWSISRVTKAVRKLRETGVITIKKYQNKSSNSTTLYVSKFGTVISCDEFDLEIENTDSQTSWLDDLFDFTLIQGMTPAVNAAINSISLIITETPKTQYAIIKASGYSKSTALRAIRALIDRGIIEVTDSGLRRSVEFFGEFDF